MATPSERIESEKGKYSFSSTSMTLFLSLEKTIRKKIIFFYRCKTIRRNTDVALDQYDDYIRRFDLFVFEMHTFTRHHSGSEEEEEDKGKTSGLLIINDHVKHCYSLQHPALIAIALLHLSKH